MRTEILSAALLIGLATSAVGAPQDEETFDQPTDFEEEGLDGEEAPPPAEDGALDKVTGEAAVEADAEDIQGPNKRGAAPPERFEEGLRAFYSDNYKDAAALMYDYIATNEATVENYEWAEYFLGVSLARMGYRHAGAEYLYNVAKNRTRPEILPEALIEIEKLFREPHDETLLVDKLIVDSDFGFLPDYISAFVRYHQGLSDLRAGRLVWAKRLFDQVPDDDPYYPKALFALAVQKWRANKTAEAVRMFRIALAHPQARRELRNECRLALARVLYEREEYKDALKIYDSVEVPELSVSEASLYLEKAWTSYWLRDFRKTMGILYALEAPSYKDFYAPEKYLLRSLVYMNLCHYIPAKREIRRFRFRFTEPLESIRQRIDLREDAVLRRAALQDGRIGRSADFRRMLAREADAIDFVGGPWIETGLDEQLRTIYGLAIEKSDLRLGAALRDQTRTRAEELVEFEEQMYLLDYEVGLAIYRRLRKEDARRQTEEDDLSIPAAGDETYFAFRDEFWNDELDTYDFFIDNRCFDAGGTE
ncbi:MAG: hypothetical protein AAF851_17930 [Myxococcota bacterium]